MGFPNDRKYSTDHEWAQVEGDLASIGITDFAQNSLGDIVFVELPAVGDTITLGDSFGEVESVKSVSELIAPISGEVVEINEALEDAPETVNSAPHDEGWMLKVSVSDAAEFDSLMDADAYQTLTEG